MTWSYVPVIKSGEDQVIQHQLTSTSDRLFLRLKYSDIVTNDPMNADFDGDGKFDLLVGASSTESSKGAAYVIFPSSKFFCCYCCWIFWGFFSLCSLYSYISFIS